MRSFGNLCHWMRQLLPDAGPCAQAAAVLLLRSLFVGFTTNLAQLARQTDRATPTKKERRFFARWLNRSHWEPETLYAGLNRFHRRLLARSGDLPLLIDFTHLAKEWSVLQVSVPWQGRALPVYRAVTHYKAPETGRRELLRHALAFLKHHLPGPHSRYVLVADRGFPGHWLVRELTREGWRFALRVTSTWKVTHPDFQGYLHAAVAVPGWVGSQPRCLHAAVLGWRGKGANEWSEANVVLYQGPGYQEPWFLVTNLADAAAAVARYRERMKIECEFRDLKGPWGLDGLAAWQDRERVARFLALVAIYEWRLAVLWLVHQLQEWGARLVVRGRLSWIRVTREWIQHRLRRSARRALARL